MDKYQNKCVTCLCNDRKLISLHEMSNVLQYIHFTELKSWNGGICWECKNIIIKFYKFKLKVYHVQHHWSKKVEQLNPLTNLGIKVNVPYNYHYNYNDPLIEIPIKEEIENSDYNLSESEEDKIKTEIEFSEHNYVEPIYNIRENLSFDDRDLHETKIETDIPTSSHMIIDRLKNDTDKEYSDVSDKFIKVIRTEDEMIKYREDKRNRHNHKKVQFKCEFCLIGFSLKNNYNDHMRLKHHESIGPYSCHVCNMRFKSMTTLADHNKMHYVYYKCKFCKYITSLQFSMLDHCSEQHDKDAVLKKVDCNVCGLKFSGLNTLKRHQSRSHSTKQKFFCDICKQSFSTKSRIESHMTKHSALIAKKLSYCSKCKIQFKALNVYRNHIMTSAQHSKSILRKMEIQMKRPKLTREEILTKKRIAERERRNKIKNYYLKYKEFKAKDRERKNIKKKEGKILLIKDQTPLQKEKTRERNRMYGRKYREKIKQMAKKSLQEDMIYIENTVQDQIAIDPLNTCLNRNENINEAIYLNNKPISRTTEEPSTSQSQSQVNDNLTKQTKTRVTRPRSRKLLNSVQEKTDTEPHATC